jgi:oligoendopeptidase F
MGHYYASLYIPHVPSYDVAEIHSQANEFLLMTFMKQYMDEDIYETLTNYNVYNTVAMALVCVAIDDFEQAVYSIENIDEYTYEDFNAIMVSVNAKYSGAPNKVTNMNEYWLSVCPNSPVYYISYATSSIAALSIYSMAQEDEALARETYRKLIEEIEEEDGFKTVMDKIGLNSPFVEETFKKIEENLIK